RNIGALPTGLTIGKRAPTTSRNVACRWLRSWLITSGGGGSTWGAMLTHVSAHQLRPDRGIPPGPQQRRLRVEDHPQRHGFEQRLHAALADEGAQERPVDELGGDLRRDAAADIDAAGGHELESGIAGFR